MVERIVAFDSVVTAVRMGLSAMSTDSIDSTIRMSPNRSVVVVVDSGDWVVDDVVAVERVHVVVSRRRLVLVVVGVSAVAADGLV